MSSHCRNKRQKIIALASEGRRQTEVHLFLCEGMHKFYTLGVEVEAVGHVAIQAVAENGGIQSLGRCGVNAQLMGATRLWIEENAGDVAGLFRCHDFKASHSLLTVVEIHLLLRHIV